MDIYSLSNFPRQPLCAAIGYFDGVHLGHAAVIAPAVTSARELGIKSAAITFNFEGFRPRGKGEADLMQRSLCFESLEALGVELILELPMAEIVSMQPRDFETLLAELGAQRVFCGRSFCYGSARSGNVDTLKAAGESLGFGVEVVEEVYREGAPVSTSRIKALVAAGEMQKAAALLAEPYRFSAPVVEEKHLARQLGFPTANQPFPDIARPRAGVYVSRTTLPDKRRLISVSNLGTRPTVGGGDYCSETHIPGFSGDLLGKTLTVELLQYLRPEQRFADLEALKNAIAADVAAALNYSEPR